MDDLTKHALDCLSTAQQASSDFDLNKDVVLPQNRKLRPAAVLVAIDLTSGVPAIWLTKRSSALKHHPGQIAFPGGKQDETDVSLEAAALREAHEEIGMPGEVVNLHGQLPAHETVTGFKVTPIVATTSKAFDVQPEPGEVEEVFRVPLGHVLNPSNFRVEERRWQGRMRAYYTVPYGPYYIWGATARMLRGWAEAFQTSR